MKTIRPGSRNTSGLSQAHNWRRESQYYRSGILEDLPCGLKAPECYAVIERGDGILLFLEDVHDRFAGSLPAHNWPLDYYRTAARCLGRFNGPYVVGRPLPEATWIPRHWLRAYIEESAPVVERVFQAPEHPIIKQVFARLPLEKLRSAWEERHAILDILEQLPQAFSHQHAFKHNLIAREDGEGCDELVAVDWSFAGPAALGSDLGVLFTASMALGDIPFEYGERLEATCLDGYLEGLSEAGWRGDPDLIRFVYSASLFWRYTFGVIIGEGFPLALDDRNLPLIERVFGRHMNQIIELMAESMNWNFKMYLQAMRLKAALGL